MSNITQSHDVVNKIKKLYSTFGYMDKHGSDVWVSVIICITFGLVISYSYYTNVLEVLRSDWVIHRCNPLFIPFAGLIHKPQNQSNLEYTAENFNGCIKSMLKNIADAAIEPFALTIRILNEACQKLIESFNLLRVLYKNLRNNYGNAIKQVYSGMVNLVISFIEFLVKMKDSMSKIHAILTTTFYSIVGAYLSMQSLFTNIIVFIIFILITIAGIIITLIILYVILFSIPFVGAAVGTPVLISSIVVTIIMICILIPILWFKFELMRAMGLTSPPTPAVPGCFSGDTEIELVSIDKTHYTRKQFKNINIGDILKHGGKVTAFMKISSETQNIYNLNGVIVTGEHRVFNKSQLKWIKVKEDPNSIHIPDFDQPFVYCLNTDEKFFKINDTTYSDWDDIDENVINKLKTNCPSMPMNFTYSDIHTHLDSGFTSDMIITLNHGETIAICDVKVNDILASGDKVVGVFKIASHDVDIYKYDFNNNITITGTKNIHIRDNNLGIINCMKENRGVIQSINIKEPLYHLLTDTGSFVINNIRVNDYNYGIDVYLN